MRATSGFQDWHRQSQRTLNSWVGHRDEEMRDITGPCVCPDPHLVLFLSQPLKHISIELLLPCKLLADPLMADSQLGLGGFVAGVELQDLLEVSPCQLKVIHCQVGLSPAEKALLIVALQLQGLMTRGEATVRPRLL